MKLRFGTKRFLLQLNWLILSVGCILGGCALGKEKTQAASCGPLLMFDLVEYHGAALSIVHARTAYVPLTQSLPARQQDKPFVVP